MIRMPHVSANVLLRRVGGYEYPTNLNDAGLIHMYGMYCKHRPVVAGVRRRCDRCGEQRRERAYGSTVGALGEDEGPCLTRRRRGRSSRVWRANTTPRRSPSTSSSSSSASSPMLAAAAHARARIGSLGGTDSMTARLVHSQRARAGKACSVIRPRQKGRTCKDCSQTRAMWGEGGPQDPAGAVCGDAGRSAGVPVGRRGDHDHEGGTMIIRCQGVWRAALLVAAAAATLVVMGGLSSPWATRDQRFTVLREGDAQDRLHGAARQHEPIHRLERHRLRVLLPSST